jgi:hypothetical protein
MPAAGETQQKPASAVEAEPKLEAEPELPKAKETQQAPVAAVVAEPKVEAEPELPKVEETQQEPVAAAGAEPEPEATRGFSIHMLPFVNRARWLFLKEKATLLSAFGKEQNRKSSQLDEVQHDVAAPVNTEPKADEEPEPLKTDEAQHEPVATVEAEPKAETELKQEPEPLKADETQHEGVASAAVGAEPELHETQPSEAHTEGQDGL